MHISTFQKMEDIYIEFLRRIWRQSKKMFGRSTTCLCRTNVFLEFHLFYEKKLHTAED